MLVVSVCLDCLRCYRWLPCVGGVSLTGLFAVLQVLTLCWWCQFDWTVCGATGGYVVITMREENRRTVEECKELDKTFAEYEKRGLWKKVSETITKNYYMEYDGLVLVYQVTKN